MSQKSENKRDLTIDFLRGVVMFILIIIHVEIFSFYDFIVWERIGVISGGEGFVILSGLITGMVYKNKLISEGFAKTSKRLNKNHRTKVRCISIKEQSLTLQKIIKHC